MRGINIKKSTLVERLQLHQTIFEYEIASFRQYIINIRQSITKQQEEFNQLFERIRERERDAEGDCGDVYEFYREEDYLYNSFTSASYNSSTLMSLYSLFKFNLMKLCSTLQECLNSNMKPDGSKKTNEIEKSRKYLELVASIEFTGLETIWEAIDNFRILRNRIAHNNSKPWFVSSRIIK
ncbi:MAG: hypothetical protein H7101_13490 [Deinococcales bacterium]|nr:hypothetical protein [Chitinophagaceae bacterium]